MNEPINPPTTFRSVDHGFSQAVSASGSRTLYVSGQTAWDAQKRIVGSDLETQARQAFANLRSVLDAAGATLADVVSVRLYIVDYAPERAAAVSRAFRACFGDATPACTWIGVSALADPAFLIEVEATAVVDAPGASMSDRLFDDYKIKLDYLTGQYQRLWQRFNFFLGVELAIFGFLGYLTFNARIADASVLPAVTGLIVSALWYIVGAEDRRLVEVYRDRLDAAATRFEQASGLESFAALHAGAEIPAGWRSIRSWYWPGLSMTRMPATFGLLSMAIWLLVLLLWPSVARHLRAS